MAELQGAEEPALDEIKPVVESESSTDPIVPPISDVTNNTSSVTMLETVTEGRESVRVVSEHIPSRLPWGATKEKLEFPENIRIDTNIKPGEFVLKTLFAEFTVLAEKKIELVLSEPLERQISKSLQRGEDTQFDQLLSSLSCVAEHCLPSLLRTLFEWYDRQNPTGEQDHRHGTKNRGEKNYLMERRDLAVDFIYCLVLIEVLRQLPYHPGHDDLVNHIAMQAFKHFKYTEGSHSGPNATNINTVADLYAEVIGVLAQSRFQIVRKRFWTELKELRSKDQNPYTIHSIVSLLMGMKFFRVKMHPIEEFTLCIQFLQDCGNYFLEVKDKDIKHALAGLFVEILLPVAAVVKMEVNVPVLKNFVENLYPTTLDLSTKRKHNLALFPMVTCLLCVSQKQFFLNNWPYFLTMCLSNLKNKDPKMSRVALESLYRLLWVYMIRIKCESNTATQSRLQSIVNSLFPKGSKVVMPRDTPLNIFVKIIQFIAQERADFALKEIIFDLLCVGRPIKFLTPERMSIGLRAFLVIADSLQQKEGDPPMPQTIGVLPSGSTLRVKKTFLNKLLSEDTAKTIGLHTYYPYVKKAFDSILRALDLQVGRPLLLTKPENVDKEPETIIIGERKPKIDLFRTCVAAIPRLIPEGMSRQDLIDLIARLTVHVDEELRGLAFQSLQNLVLDLADWREDVISIFIQFIQKEVNDTFPQLLDNALRMLGQFLVQWKTAAQSPQASREKTDTVPELSAHKLPFDRSPHAGVLCEVEGFALVMLCNCRPITRKLAVLLLKEVKSLFSILGFSKVDDPCMIDVMDKACPGIIEKILPNLPSPERASILSAYPIDLSWLADRTSSVWVAGYHDSAAAESGHKTACFSSFDPWVASMSMLLDHERVLGCCPMAVSSAWPILYSRLTTLYTYVDPSSTLNENRASLLTRSGSKKVTNERDMYLNLWHNYIVFASCIAPSNRGNSQRCSSPDLNSSSPDNMISETLSNIKPSGNSVRASDLFKLIVHLIRCETADMRDTVVNGLGRINPDAFGDLIVELLPYIKEAIDRNKENLKRRKRRDILRVQLAKIFKLMAENGVFAQSNPGVIDKETHALSTTFVDYIEGARLYLETEGEKDFPLLQEIRLHFSGFIRHLIRNTPVEHQGSLLSRELRYNLFYLFASWSGKFGQNFGAVDRRLSKDDDCTELELSAVQAMSAVLCCGPVFDASALGDDGYIYSWLDILLGSHDEKIYQLSQETIVLLLENNQYSQDAQALLDWVIDRCFTGPNEVADGCFMALAQVFNNREYPCDHVAMLNVTLLHTGCPRISIHETALQMLQLLDKRFFLDEAIVTDGGEEEDGHKTSLSLNEVLLTATYSRSQLYLSEQLARLHPELTIPIFSEITHRFQTARYTVRQLLLTYLLPWLHNMELVDAHLPPGNPLSNFILKMQDAQSDYMKPPLKGDGWGSTQATEMVLNNLFYITAKFGDDHPRELENLWAALVACWPNNLKVIIRYLIIIAGMAPYGLLTYAKRVIVYLGRAKPEKLVDELMNELQTLEPLTFNVERTETPPFYRLTLHKRVNLATVSMGPMSHDLGLGQEQPLEKGVLHTKRLSAEDPGNNDKTPRTNSTASLRSTSSTSSASSTASSVRGPPAENGQAMAGAGEQAHALLLVDDDIPLVNKVNAAVEMRQTELPIPYPLPMPAYGGYFAPLAEFLPDGTFPIQGFHRCNLAVMLLTDLVVDGIQVDWTAHLPLMLHIIFLGLDHTRMYVYEHCKKLLLNLLIVLAAHNDHHSVAKTLLSNKDCNKICALTVPVEQNKEFTFIDGAVKEAAPELSSQMGVGQSTFSVNSATTITPETVSSLVDVDVLQTTDQVVKALIDFLSTRKCRPLWSYEDITSRTHKIRSAEQLEHFLKHVLKIFQESLPQAQIGQRWAQIALTRALSCSSRHYAGRSFQIFRALRVPLNSRMLSDVLGRLVETVAEQGEDMQGYVTEIMLTLEAAVDTLDMDFRPIESWKELFLSTPNLSKEPKVEMRKSATIALRHSPPSNQHHMRSTSYSLSGIRRSAASPPIASETKVDYKFHRISADLECRKSTNLSRSRSAQSLKNLADNSSDDKLTILSQMFWLAVSLLESDYEHEFLLAIRLLEKYLKHLQPDRPDCRERLDKILQQINWPDFPGVQAMLLKGLTSGNTAEATWHLLAHLTPFINAHIIDPSQALAFPMNVIALLPYMVEHYEAPTRLCRDAAEHISCMCLEQGQKLENLATVMTLYSRGTFAKNSFQWTKCVVKYLHDVYAELSVNMMAFLVEVLEKGPNNCQSAVLQILHCMVHYIDMNSSPVQAMNSDLLKVIAKYIEGPHYKEALKILKMSVTRSSTLAAPPPSMSSSSTGDLSSISSHTSFAEAEVISKKELPGRTIEFTFDFSQMPIIGYRCSSVSSASIRSLSVGSTCSSGSSGATSGSSTTTTSPSSSLRERGLAWWGVDGGRTMDFTFDLSQTPIIGRKFMQLQVDIPLEGESSDNREKIDTASEAGKESILSSESYSSGATETLTCSWKKPHMSQARTRERLVNLLPSYGQKAGLPKSPSDTLINKVIFSQSSDTIERQASMCSSSEEASLQEGVPGDMKLEESTNSEKQFLVFNDFDFLDLELEDTESEDSNRFFGLKRQSIPKPEEKEVTVHEGRSGSASVKEESSDDEQGSVSPVDEAMANELAASSTILVHNTLLLDRTRRHSSPMSGSTHDEGSDVDTTDISTGGASPSSGPMAFYGDEIDEIWRSHINKIMYDNSGVHTGNTYHLFARLFHETRRKLSTFTKEACYFLAKADNLRSVAAQLSTMLEMMSSHAECPFVYADADMLLACKILDKHKFHVLEINEGYETYIMKKEQAAECLDGIKSSVKLQSLGENVSDFCGDDQKIELCRCLYKLHFQLLLLFETYTKMVGILTSSAQGTSVSDLSEEVSSIRQELQRAVSESDTDLPAFQLDTNTISRGDMEQQLVQHLKSNQPAQAIQLLRSVRTQCAGDFFGVCTEDDVEALLTIYCRSVSENKPGVMAVSGSERDLTDVCNKLMEVNIQLSTSIRLIEQAAKLDREVIMKPPESSTL